LRRALTVIVAALVMSALILGAALTVMALGDSSTAVVQAQANLLLLRGASSAFELSLRSATLVYLDSYAEALSNVSPSYGIAQGLSQGLEAALGKLSFASSVSVSVDSLSAEVAEAPDGAIVACVRTSYTVSDAEGDSLSYTHSLELQHGLRLLAASSIVLSQNNISLALLGSMAGSSLADLSGLNGSYVDASSGLTVVTRLFAIDAGSVELSTSVADAGRCEALSGSYSYVVQLNSIVPFDWSQ